MPKKKSIRRCAASFRTDADAILAFLEATTPGASADHVTWLYEYAIIRLYRIFEGLILEALVGAVNNDTTTLATTARVKLPKHLTDEVCEYLITGGNYFDFKGRDGLIKEIKAAVPATHYLAVTVKDTKYTDALNQLSASRNYAAHASSVAKARFKEAVGAERVPSAGAWLKRQKRFDRIAGKLKDLAGEIEAQAPY